MEAKPLLRWAGSKRRLVPKLKVYWNDDFKRYIEPFAGSAHLYFSLKVKKAILGDTNKELIDTYKIIKKSPRKVYNNLIKLPRGRANYYKIRSLDINDLNQVERAARFIYLNKFCFNGLYRTNKNGIFNVPYSGYKTGNIPSWEIFKASALKLSKSRFICDDFEELVSNHLKPKDFIYMDPPYAVTNRRIFKQYNAQTFGIEDLKRLSGLLKKIDKTGAGFVVSYAYCKEALELFDGWNIRIISTQRHIAGFGKFRRRAKELLISNIQTDQQ